MRLSLLTLLILTFTIYVVSGHSHHNHDHDHDEDVSDDDDDIDYSYVTCGSLVKLIHVNTNHRLHSHEIPYGGGEGSGQQSVTGMAGADDPNSLWLIKGVRPGACKRGKPVKNGQQIRLEHVNTRKNLHSHLFKSPLTGQQEVSAFGDEGEGDKGDFWRVVLLGGKLWKRGANIRLQHVVTKKWLHSHNHRYQNPIPGQTEVTCFQEKNRDNLWKTGEGIFAASEQ